MGIYRGTAEYTDALHNGAGPVWQVRNGGDLVWPEYGALFAMDDGQQLLKVPPGNPAGATVVADTSTSTINPVRGLVHEGRALFGVKGDIIINPTQAQVWEYTQAGVGEQIGVLPDSGTADIDAAGGLAYDHGADEVYIVDRVTTTSSAIFRTQGSGTSGFFASGDSSRLVFPASQAAALSIDEHITAIACYGGFLWVVDGSGDVRKGATGEDTLSLSDVGSLPGTLNAIRGLTAMHGWMVGVDDSDQLIRWPPDDPSSALKLTGVIPNVSGEIEALAYVPAAEVD